MLLAVFVRPGAISEQFTDAWADFCDPAIRTGLTCWLAGLTTEVDRDA